MIELFETTMAIAAIPTFMRVFDADAAAVGWTTAGVASATSSAARTFTDRKLLLTTLILRETPGGKSAWVGSPVGSLRPRTRA
ncbi:hypothetical protein [Actinomadura rugatobispora]|uniref:Uncharacterized protein n=1 Tax=Actinomadura rugatobispora TaxID=1994 RepID=A0ABW0ZVB7_9ACTN|nr:hypothetical protein GCM10010200_103300 [Actinomadura rugatobispora]